jgi:hypothetical protein
MSNGAASSGGRSQASAPEPQPEPQEETPLFPERSYGAERRKGGWMGLFGGRGKNASYESAEPPSYRQSAAASPARGGAAPAAAQAEDPDAADAADDLDIPSFLRRLAN